MVLRRFLLGEPSFFPRAFPCPQVPFFLLCARAAFLLEPRFAYNVVLWYSPEFFTGGRGRGGPGRGGCTPGFPAHCLSPTGLCLGSQACLGPGRAPRGSEMALGSALTACS